MVTRSQPELLQICLGLAKLKVENKKMLAYLLFDSDNPLGYASQIKEQMDAVLWEIPRGASGMTKALRKALQLITQYNRFTKFKQGEVELLLHFLTRYLQIVSPEARHPPLLGLAFRALRKAHGLIGKLHEDLQFDYAHEYNKQVKTIEEGFYHWDRHRFPLQTLQ